MKFTHLPAWLALVLLTNTALGQPPRIGRPEPGSRKGYVDFGIDPEYKRKLEERLNMENELGPLKDLVKQILADPKLLNLDPGKLKEMKLEDKPELRKAVEDWVRHDPALQESLRNWIKQNSPDKQTPDAQKLHKDIESILQRSAEKAAEPLPEIPQWKDANTPIKPKDDPLKNLTERAMKEAERTQIGEWLRESPAWQRAFEDLRGSLNQPNGPPGILDDWPSNLFNTDGGALKLADDALSRIKEMPRPRLDRFQWNVPGVSNILLPDIGPAGVGDLSGPPLPSLGMAVNWLLLVLILLLIGWRVMLYSRWSVPAVNERPNLGPWPVRPEAVATRAELIQAFDYLALWTLGLAVQSWNHHAVAGRWREKAPACAEVAQALAKLYEQARYTVGIEPLAEADRELARRSLAKIAEAL